MFVILLKFSEKKSSAPTFMDDHNAWLRQGFSDGIFVLAGSLSDKQGGAILAHNESLSKIKDRVALDPFVKEGVVTSEIIEISPGKAIESLNFLV
jgi:uncharacterized protein YciI